MTLRKLSQNAPELPLLSAEEYEETSPMATTNNSNGKSSLKSFLTIQNDKFQLILYIFGWYSFSLTISLYNKWMFDKSTLNLPFPILITSFHQLLLSILSFITIYLNPSLKKDHHTNNSWKFYLSNILPCSMASAGDIGAGNMSFRFITLTTYTMCKSSSIAFVLLFGIITNLEKFSFNLLGIVLLMSFGVVLMVDRSDTNDSTQNHHFLGVSLVLLSSCMSGLRWVFTQLLLKKNNNNGNDLVKQRKNPILTIYQLSPSMFVILFIIGILIEGLTPFLNADIWYEKGIPKTILLLLFPGILVFFMTFFEFGILQRAQVLTLSIAGILKEILTIVVSCLLFNDRLTFINLIGLLITLIDICWYNYYRFQIQKKEADDLKRSQSHELENV